MLCVRTPYAFALQETSREAEEIALSIHSRIAMQSILDGLSELKEVSSPALF
jgi:hypothetical protein